MIQPSADKMKKNSWFAVKEVIEGWNWTSLADLAVPLVVVEALHTVNLSSLPPCLAGIDFWLIPCWLVNSGCVALYAVFGRLEEFLSLALELSWNMAKSLTSISSLFALANWR